MELSGAPVSKPHNFRRLTANGTSEQRVLRSLFKALLSYRNGANEKASRR